MPWSRPSLSTLIARIASDIQSQLPGTNPLLRRSLLGILGRANAGAVHGLYGHQVIIADQIMPDTSDETYTQRWASIFGVPRTAATVATGPVVCTGADDTIIETGTQLMAPSGTEYVTTADGTIAGGSVQVPVAATVAGSAGNQATGATLNFVAPIAGVMASATVAAPGLGGGADVESIDNQRARLLQRIRTPPQAGTANDYTRWALEVAGVTRVWIFPAELTPNGVTVRIAADNGATAPIPDQATVDAVQAHLDTLRPATAIVTVMAPVATPLNPEIQLTPDTVAVRNAVTAELQDLLVREAAPGGTLLLSHINEAIAVAAGETDHQLVSPAADVVFGGGQLAVLGDIAWQ